MECVGFSRGMEARSLSVVQQIVNAIATSPSVEETGRIALENVQKYDKAFFAAFDEVIARDRAQLRIERAEKLEQLRDYLREVRRRADSGQLEQMREELAAGASQEKIKRKLMDAARADPTGVAVDLDEILRDMRISDLKPEQRGQVMEEIMRRALADQKPQKRPRRRGWLSRLTHRSA